MPWPWPRHRKGESIWDERSERYDTISYERERRAMRSRLFLWVQFAYTSSTVRVQFAYTSGTLRVQFAYTSSTHWVQFTWKSARRVRALLSKKYLMYVGSRYRPWSCWHTDTPWRILMICYSWSWNRVVSRLPAGNLETPWVRIRESRDQLHGLAQTTHRAQAQDKLWVRNRFITMAVAGLARGEYTHDTGVQWLKWKPWPSSIDARPRHNHRQWLSSAEWPLNKIWFHIIKINVCRYDI